MDYDTELAGIFWRIEHSTPYKEDANTLRGIVIQLEKDISDLTATIEKELDYGDSNYPRFFISTGQQQNTGSTFPERRCDLDR